MSKSLFRFPEIKKREARPRNGGQTHPNTGQVVLMCSLDEMKFKGRRLTLYFVILNNIFLTVTDYYL